jgi:phosphatidylglycerophosphatase A
LKDPGKVVVDEVAGQMIALLPLSFLAGVPLISGVIVSFILFRLFDIFKPYPARRFERLRGGLGIMADDLVAGFYGAVGTALVMWIWR